MLVLTRKIGESFVIGDGIVVTLVSVGNGRAKIGVQAPKEIPVYREEIHQKILAEKLVPGADGLSPDPAPTTSPLCSGVNRLGRSGRRPDRILGDSSAR